LNSFTVDSTLNNKGFNVLWSNSILWGRFEKNNKLSKMETEQQITDYVALARDLENQELEVY
jgi:hypothetical protein